MRYRWLFFLVVSLSTAMSLHAQENSIKPKPARPKIGLCLSGGGAKGLAYIPLLKVIDSLGLKIDYITGTSMGGLVGGLYAIGYSGYDLDTLARKLNWDGYLRDDLPMSKINMEEKDEYGRYLLELKSNNMVPSLPMGLIEGQNIMRFLNDVTFRVNHIQDFSQFKIPFKCYAADMVGGVPVELSKGSLALALRATMSIPSAFTPIDTGNMLLVDGGVLKNFPVEEVRAMGADFVIGGNTSGAPWKKRQLTSLLRVFDQTMTFNSSENYEKQKELCDILIDYTEALRQENFGSSDFNSAAEIIDLGERVVTNFIPLLAQLAEDQKEYLIENPEPPQENLSNSVQIERFQIAVEENSYQAIIRNKIEFEDPGNATRYEINRAVDRIYGTRFFDRVYYYMNCEEGGEPKLVFKTEGAKKFAYKIGLHYDPELSAGITLNLTYRRLGKYTSRSILSFDLSDNPKIRAGYQVYFGDSGWWLNTEHFFSAINQVSYISRKALGYYTHYYENSNVSVNWTIGQNNLISLGTGFEYFNRKPAIRANERLRFEGSNVVIARAPFYNTHIFIKLARNTLDKPVFPTKGIFVQGYLKLTPWGQGKLGVYTDRILPDSSGSHTVYSLEKPDFSGYAKLHLQFEQYIPLHKIMRLHYRWDLGMMFLSHGLKGREFLYPNTDAFYMGGIDSRERERLNMYIPFWGNKEGYAQAYNFSSLMVEAQIEPVRNILILPRFSVMTYDDAQDVVYDDEIFLNKFKGNLLWAWSGGAAVAYKSPIGPLKVSLAKASNYDRLIFYASLGYRF